MSTCDKINALRRQSSERAFAIRLYTRLFLLVPSSCSWIPSSPHNSISNFTSASLHSPAIDLVDVAMWFEVSWKCLQICVTNGYLWNGSVYISSKTVRKPLHLVFGPARKQVLVWVKWNSLERFCAVYTRAQNGSGTVSSPSVNALLHVGMTSIQSQWRVFIQSSQSRVCCKTTKLHNYNNNYINHPININHPWEKIATQLTNRDSANKDSYSYYCSANYPHYTALPGRLQDQIITVRLTMTAYVTL